MYRSQCLDSQRQWREQHPDYMRAYRRAPKVSPLDANSEIVKLLAAVKNNVAFDLKKQRAKVFLIGCDPRMKNTLASVEVIVIKRLSTG